MALRLPSKATAAPCCLFRWMKKGSRVDGLEGSGASLIYVTPSHQFPTGVTMSQKRRADLLEWAERNGAYIIEDDYDSDFRYDGPPLMALAGLNSNTSVIYLGTFSKSVGSGLRTGYAIVPRQLIEPMRRVKASGELRDPWIEQVVWPTSSLVVGSSVTCGAFDDRTGKRESRFSTRSRGTSDPPKYLARTEACMSCGSRRRTILNAKEVAAIAAAEGVGVYTVEKAGRSSSTLVKASVVSFLAILCSRLKPPRRVFLGLHVASISSEERTCLTQEPKLKKSARQYDDARF